MELKSMTLHTRILLKIVFKLFFANWAKTNFKKLWKDYYLFYKNKTNLEAKKGLSSYCSVIVCEHLKVDSFCHGGS